MSSSKVEKRGEKHGKIGLKQIRSKKIEEESSKGGEKKAKK